jgi:hypothetical protein
MGPGRVAAIFICPSANGRMESVTETNAIVGEGLTGDWSVINDGDESAEPHGQRSVTLANGMFFRGSNFGYADSRRNIITFGVELMSFIGKNFRIGDVLLRGVSYCDTVTHPANAKGGIGDFRYAFYDRCGIVAAILESGAIKVNDRIFPG